LKPTKQRLIKANVLHFLQPNELVAFACGSRSTIKIRLSDSANAAPRFTAVVVLPDTALLISNRDDFHETPPHRTTGMMMLLLAVNGNKIFRIFRFGVSAVAV